MRKISILGALVAIALLAGCGSSSSKSTSSSSASTASAPKGAGLTLSESEFKITPASLSAAKGGTVTISVKNTGAITHALAVQTPSGVVRTQAIAPGASATLTVNVSKAGSYQFYCPIANHRQLGMKGVLVVGAAHASAPAPTPAATSSSSNSPY